ncbi:hypothetical protein METHPM2_1820002 [Pseudomonas sp. PM2]
MCNKTFPASQLSVTSGSTLDHGFLALSFTLEAYWSYELKCLEATNEYPWIARSTAQVWPGHVAKQGRRPTQVQ